MSTQNIVRLPAFCDVHVHFREPGFGYKETIESGCKSAYAGGYSDVCTMPNLMPVPDCLENLQKQLDCINSASEKRVKVHPYGSITIGQNGNELSDMSQLASYVIAFSDDGKGVQNRQLMRDAMIKAKSLDKIIVAHCEENSLLTDSAFGVKGYIHKGKYAVCHSHPGICSESEWRPIERDIGLAKETGCSYHVCHISCKESVELIRRAKAQGVDITCETAPHYLILDDSHLCDEGRFKMNPPLRDASDREALVEGLLDGTIDMIATDHAPHSAEEKSKGLKDSAFGIVGLETAFPLMYTCFVRTGIITLERLCELMAYNPRRRFKIQDNSFVLWDLDEKYKIDSSNFKTMGRATPFEGFEVYGKIVNWEN